MSRSEKPGRSSIWATVLLGLVLVGVVGVIFGPVTFLCSDTPVPIAGVPVPAAAMSDTGATIPEDATCTGGVGATCNNPGEVCWLFWNCNDSWDSRTGNCVCTCGTWEPRPIPESS